MKKCILTVLLLICCFSVSAQHNLSTGLVRDSVAISFEFANAELVLENDSLFYQFQVLASAGAEGTRLGTGIVYINYNPLAFGENIFNWGEVEVQPLALLQTEPYSAYGIIVQDNTVSRLAVTFEYLQNAGYGNPLPITATPLLGIAIPVLATGESAALSFQETLMQNQQYYDDNATIYSPVIATDIDETILEFTAADPQLPEYCPRTAVAVFPNPGNPEVNFMINLSGTEPAELIIYNLKGQRIISFPSNPTTCQPLHSITWNGCDEQQREVGSGTYLYEFRMAKASVKGKFSIIK